MSASLPPLRVRPSAVCLVCGGLILLSMSLVRFCCGKMGHLNDRSSLFRTHHCCRLCDEDDACAQPLRLCVHALCAAAPTQKWEEGERRGGVRRWDRPPPAWRVPGRANCTRANVPLLVHTTADAPATTIQTQPQPKQSARALSIRPSVTEQQQNTQQQSRRGRTERNI